MRERSPRDDRDVALGNAKGPGEEGDELVVGGAVDGRGGEPDEQGAVAQAGESAAAGARNDPDVEIARDPDRQIRPGVSAFGVTSAGRGAGAGGRLPPAAAGGAGRARRASARPDRG